jgi:hypothetical protein
VKRKAAGGTILLVAILVSVVLGRVSSGGVRGQAAPESGPKPPPAGLCIVESGDLLEPVSCETLHHAQIVQVWSAWDQEVINKSSSELKGECWLAGSKYLDTVGLSRISPYADLPPGPNWSPVPLIIDTDVLVGPRHSGNADWVACVLRPRSAVTPTVKDPLAPVGKFSGQIQDLVPMATRPLNLRSCYADRSFLPATVPCRSWHRGEVLGARLIRGTSDLPPQDLGVESELRNGCEAIASVLLNVTDPTVGGQLVVLVASEPFPNENGEARSAANERYVRCLIERPAGMLTDSLIGIGDAALPLADRN